jgi:PilZ domain
MREENANANRRSKQRVAARLPVKVRASSSHSEFTAETRDVSTNGVFLYTQSRLEIGSMVELVLILPEELTSIGKSWVCCHARVVRVEQGEGRSFGVAAEIQRMDVLPEIPTA